MSSLQKTKTPIHQQNLRQLNRRSFKQQQGIVIVVALFFVALIATMAYTMVARLERDTRRTQLILRDTQAELYAQGSIAWAIDRIRNDWELHKDNLPVDKAIIKSPVKEVDGYQIASLIQDMQARFNLNNLSQGDVNSEKQFAQLIRVVQPAMTERAAIEIAKSLSEWLMPVTSSEGNQYYFALPTPYRPAHQLMLTREELRLVKGMTNELYTALEPYITALPAITKLNVETASPIALMTLSAKLPLDAAKAIVQSRQAKPFIKPQDFLDLAIVKNFNLPSGKITTVSDYFLVETEVKIEKQHIVLYTLLQRITKDKQATVNILWQSKGSW